MLGQGRVLSDVFIYPHTNASGKHGYLIEHDSRPSEAPHLLSMLKRYVLRSKVKIKDVSEEYDVWAAWGSETEQGWETQRRWNWSRSGVIEPTWGDADEWPWGNDVLALLDRRAVGMGRRMLIKKGDRRKPTITSLWKK
jgi:folate-binding Fe-S cluster repair protein YgfZ